MKRKLSRNVPSGEASALAPGTLCFLTKITTVGGEYPCADLNGRVVEVVGGPREKWGDGPGPFYDIRAPWITERFPGRDLICQRPQLIPISPGVSEAGHDAREPLDEPIPGALTAACTIDRKCRALAQRGYPS